MIVTAHDGVMNATVNMTVEEAAVLKYAVTLIAQAGKHDIARLSPNVDVIQMRDTFNKITGGKPIGFTKNT